MPLPVIGVGWWVAGAVGLLGAGYVTKDLASPENVANHNYPAQPDAETIYFSGGPTVVDNTALYIAGAVTLYGLYQWSKKA